MRVVTVRLRGSGRLAALLLTALLFTCTAALARDPVKGLIVDKNNQPVAGATVSIKNKKTTVATGSDGSFTIEADTGDVLLVSFVGYADQEFIIRPGINIRIVLEESRTAMDDVVVVGYATQKRRSITGAISSVQSQDLVRTPAVATSTALVGKVQGITARAGDARPGNGTAIQIRNMGTPLFLIDGVPSDEGSFNQLGLEDIADISILKDAAAAIYGMRAANGAIVVTTKKGRAGEKTAINLSGYYGLQNYTRYPRPANAYQHLRGLAESEQNFGRAPGITREELEKWRIGTEKNYQSFDYYEMINKPNVPQYYINGSASGGSEKMNYYISLSHLNQDAVIKDYNFNRTNLQTNIDAGIAKGLKVGTQISARIEDRYQVGVPGLDDYFNPFLSIFSMWPTERPYANDNPNYINNTHNVNVNPATYQENITGYVNDIWRAMKANFYAQYDFKFGLSLKGTTSYGYILNTFDGQEYTYNAYKYNPNNDTYEQQGGNPNPWRWKQRTNTIELYSQLTANYQKQLGDHSITLFAGYERSSRESTFQRIASNPPNNYIPIIKFENQIDLVDTWSIEAREGYIGRINYNYQQKYFFETFGRYDGSYLYAKNNRWGFFPTVSVGWRISEENFLRDRFSWLTDLKLRISYGQNGTESGVNAFGYLPGATFGGTLADEGRNAVFDGVLTTGSRLRGLPVTNLSWVKNHNKNIGLDFAFLNNKLSGQIDVFERKRTGLPAARYDVLLPSEVGYVLPNENLNSDVHRGIEGIITWRSRAGAIDYSIGVNATVSRLRVLDRYKPRTGNSWDTYRNTNESVDRWAGITWGYQVIGRFQSQKEIENHPINNDGRGNTSLLPGDFIYKDVNGDGTINGLDERPIGYATGTLPYMSFGINGSVGYKGFNLAFDFAGATMQSFLREWELRYPYQNNGTLINYMAEDRWHRADVFDPNSAWIPGKYPAIRRDNNNHSNYWTNDFWLTNVHYLRLRNLELSYTFAQKLARKVGLSRFRVYANGTNLFSIDNVRDLGIDPEITSGNGLIYPQQRLYNFGFNATF